jgi:hypothetical protein
MTVNLLLYTVYTVDKLAEIAFPISRDPLEGGRFNQIKSNQIK